jgi:uroporphyrinogen decarboxylase
VENGMFYKVFTIKTPERTLKQVESGPNKELNQSAVHLQTMEFLIKDELDFEAFSKYVPPIDKSPIEEIREYCVWANGIVGENGLLSPWGISSVFNFATKLRNMSDVMMDAYINPGFYDAYMSKLTEIIIRQDREIALATKDLMGIQGNIANSGMTGKQFFDEHILPFEKRIVDAISETGCCTLYHNCGKAKVLQESYIDLGITAWETVADEPIGDNELSHAKRNVGDKITLVGNLDQVKFLKTASIKEVEKKTEELVAIGKPGGRYVFSCSDYLEIGTPLENVEAMIRTTKAVGKY